jgi:hypothetical protein
VITRSRWAGIAKRNGTFSTGAGAKTHDPTVNPKFDFLPRKSTVGCAHSGASCRQDPVAPRHFAGVLKSLLGDRVTIVVISQREPCAVSRTAQCRRSGDCKIRAARLTARKAARTQGTTTPYAPSDRLSSPPGALDQLGQGLSRSESRTRRRLPARRSIKPPRQARPPGFGSLALPAQASNGT